MGARLEVALPACHTDRESCLTYRLDLAGSPARNEHPTGGALRFFDIEPLPESEGGLGLVWEEVEDAAAGLPFGGEPMSEQGKLQRRQTMLCRSWLFVNGADEVELAVAPASGADVLIQDIEDFTPPAIWIRRSQSFSPSNSTPTTTALFSRPPPTARQPDMPCALARLFRRRFHLGADEQATRRQPHPRRAAEAGQLKSSGIPPAPETISDVLEPRC
jgi:hypothetical protein